MLDRVNRSSLMKAWWAEQSPAQRHAHGLKIAASRKAHRAAQTAVRTRRRRGHLGRTALIPAESALAIRIEKLYREGYSGPVIAHRVRTVLGSPVAPGTIYRVLRDRGVERRASGWQGEVEAPAATNGHVDTTAEPPASPQWIAQEIERLTTERARIDEGLTLLMQYRAVCEAR